MSLYTLVIKLQLEGEEEIRERHQTVDGVVHQNYSTGKEREKNTCKDLDVTGLQAAGWNSKQHIYCEKVDVGGLGTS